MGVESGYGKYSGITIELIALAAVNEPESLSLRQGIIKFRKEGKTWFLVAWDGYCQGKIGD